MQKTYFIVALFLLSNAIRSNNLSIGIPSLNTNNELVFTVSWDNSWYTNSAPHNWDGVYLFVKYRDCASSGAWKHVKLSTALADHSAQSPLQIDSYLLSDGMGVIVRRSAIGSGNITNDTIKLKIVTPALGSSYDFQVFGIEMVYIPKGAFYLGDGISNYTITDGASSNPFYVANDNSLTRGTAAGQIYCTSASSTLPATIPAGYPVGYDSVYVMKYEISQGQYIGFLNSLASDQAAARFTNVNASRINITGSWPNYTTTFPHRAMGYMSWQDLTAFLDWAAMRPMTETEFEKISRGPNYPVTGEYAWGTSTITDVTGLNTDGTATEKNSNAASVGTGLANYNNDVILGPMRCGFASGSATDRLQSGAGYYGVMELSGNIGELCVNLYDAVGRSFTTAHGDGLLTGSPSAGYADVGAWPSTSSGYAGVIFKGGGFSEGYTYLRVSDRYAYYDASAGGRYNNRGGRGIR